MDLEKLAADWKDDPALQRLAFETVEQLADHLRSVHKYLTDPEKGGPFAYLYIKQIERNRALKKELEDVRAKHPRR